MSRPDVEQERFHDRCSTWLGDETRVEDHKQFEEESIRHQRDEILLIISLSDAL